MEKYVIYNTVPAYRQEAENNGSLQADFLKIIEDFHLREEEKAFVIVPKESRICSDSLSGQMTVIEAESSYGLVYQNSSALNQLVCREKPRPQKHNSREHITLSGLEGKQKITVERPDGKVRTIEMSNETSIRELLKLADCKIKIKAVCCGYPSFRLLTEAELDTVCDSQITYLKVIGEEDCILDELLRLAAFYRRETCGNCVFGYEGTAQMQMILMDISQKKGKVSDMDLLRELAETMLSQTSCEVCAGEAVTLLDAIEKLGPEIEQHIVKKNCPSGVCARFVTYHILADQCNGCMDCLEVCEEEAILGKKRFVHVIDQDLCIQCGKCVNACAEGAIIKAGSVKPRCPAKPIPCKRS